MQTEEIYFFFWLFTNQPILEPNIQIRLCAANQDNSFDLKIQACRKSTVIIWREKDEATILKIIQEAEKRKITYKKEQKRLRQNQSVENILKRNVNVIKDLTLEKKY